MSRNNDRISLVLAGLLCVIAVEILIRGETGLSWEHHLASGGQARLIGISMLMIGVWGLYCEWKKRRQK